LGAELDISDDKLEFAKSIGADFILNSKTGKTIDALKEIKKTVQMFQSKRSVIRTLFTIRLLR
jgi:D-arabinose 1-dehydrogenase-like Zn-dependent alcohol dehydrogenase